MPAGDDVHDGPDDPAAQSSGERASEQAPESPSDAATGSAAAPELDPQELDPRAIRRASLQAGRNPSLWWTSAAIVVAVVVSLVVGTRAGAYTLAVALAVCAVVRVVLPQPGPVALSVRAKPIDVTVLTVLAASIAALAGLLPGNLS